MVVLSVIGRLPSGVLLGVFFTESFVILTFFAIAEATLLPRDARFRRATLAKP